MKSFLHQANRLLAGFAGWLMLAMMTLLVIDILSRSMDMPLHGLAEMSVFPCVSTVDRLRKELLFKDYT